MKTSPCEMQSKRTRFKNSLHSLHFVREASKNQTRTAEAMNVKTFRYSSNISGLIMHQDYETVSITQNMHDHLTPHQPTCCSFVQM
jgi:hypothetical protein